MLQRSVFSSLSRTSFMTFLYTTSFVLLCLVCGAAVPASATTRFALLVGNNTGMSGEAQLRWAQADAEKLRDVLVDLGNVSLSRSTLLLESTPSQMDAEIKRLKKEVDALRRRGERVELFFYYSGHGDTDSLHLGENRYALADLKKNLRTVPADAIVAVVDACRSGTLRSGRNKGASLAPAFDISLVQDLAPTGMVLLSSASVGEVAQESDDLGGAFFTHHLVAGLRGAADGDADRVVTLHELYQYTYSHTLAGSFATRAAVQHPELVTDLRGQGQLVVSSLDAAKATLVLPASIGGQFLLVDETSGRVILEVRKGSGSALSLAVPPRRLLVQQRDGAQLYSGTVSLEWGGKMTLNASALRLQNRFASVDRGGTAGMPRWISLGSGIASSVIQPPESGIVSGTFDLGGGMLLYPWPIVLYTRQQAFTSTYDGDLFTFYDLSWRALVGAGAVVEIGAGSEPMQLMLGLSGGATTSMQILRHFDGDRVDAVVDDGASIQTTWAVSPTLALDASLQIPIGNGFSVYGAMQGAGAWMLSASGTGVGHVDASASAGLLWRW